MPDDGGIDAAVEWAVQMPEPIRGAPSVRVLIDGAMAAGGAIIGKRLSGLVGR